MTVILLLFFVVFVGHLMRLQGAVTWSNHPH